MLHEAEEVGVTGQEADAIRLVEGKQESSVHVADVLSTLTFGDVDQVVSEYEIAMGKVTEHQV